MALAMAAERRVGDFEVQGLTNTAWAFGKAGEPAPGLLDPSSVLDMIDVKGAKPQMLDYQLLMQCLATMGKLQAGFVLLAEGLGGFWWQPTSEWVSPE